MYFIVVNREPGSHSDEWHIYETPPTGELRSHERLHEAEVVEVLHQSERWENAKLVQRSGVFLYADGRLIGAKY